VNTAHEQRLAIVEPPSAPNTLDIVAGTVRQTRAARKDKEADPPAGVGRMMPDRNTEPSARQSIGSWTGR